ncbi:MAG: hypothetical protein M0P01_05430 [Treponema sp.]|nr:hypothetical protein [Treponema sp.]
MLSVKKFWQTLTKKQKIILSILCTLLVLDVVFFFQKYFFSSSPVVLTFPSEMHAASGHLRALNINARTAASKSGYAYYKFTQLQQNKLHSYFEKNGDAAVVVSIHVKQGKKYKTFAAGGEIPLMYGFLFKNDFEKNGSMKKEIVQRPLVSTDLRDMTDFELSLSLQKNIPGNTNTVPAGFFVYAPVPASVTGAAVRNAALGWDKSGTVPFYGFAPNGGQVHAQSDAVDFSGASLVFAAQNTSSSVLPRIILSFGKSGDYGTVDNPSTMLLNAGGEQYTLYRTKSVDDLEIHTSALKNPFSRMEIENAKNSVTSFVMMHDESALVTDSGKSVLVPFKTDPGFILNWPQENWRTSDYELFEWNRFPGVLFFDTRDYDVQNDFFRRLAYYAEKTGYRGTLLSDAELKGKHGYNAHDYSAETLAAFFTKAASENFQLNEKEYLLRDILIANKIIEKNNNLYKTGRGAVISVSQNSAKWLRGRFIAHEGWHGIFFTDGKFRNAVTAVYYTMDQKSLEFLTNFWHTQADLDYDMNDTYLVHNEFMAYLMQQPFSGVADYFVHLANRASVVKKIPELAAYVRNNRGIQFEDAARVLNEYAFDNWGLSCGRVSLVR